ncbi:DUF1488 domain-containing protein [Mesorhizobium sp. UC74_2]|jgi:hypothetical protein|uniref:DUF1488 domain-containing protein n=1 Tax=Mesorhizobium sp. UC74_2 TaxID=3350171 RepID=UPI00366C59C1
MTLEFPNQSRSFDEMRSAIRFSGYDGMMQVPFLIEAAALPKSTGLTAARTPSEAVCLAAFDQARASIEKVARIIYSRNRRPLYVLTSHDFAGRSR